MRKLRVFESISIDGYFTDATGDLSWAHAGPRDPEFDRWVAGNATSKAELLLGRRTYQMMEAFWPTPAAIAQMPEVAHGMNSARKYVASRSLTPTWSNAHLLKGELVEAVTELKAQTGPDLTVLGSGSIATQLGDAGLVDEYMLVIVPIALGAGRTVFSSRRRLRLVAQRAFDSGNVLVTYAT